MFWNKPLFKETSMLYVVLENEELNVWDMTRKTKPDVDIRKIIYIQANGFELDQIRSLFETIPIPRKTAHPQNVWWYGDMAKFIFGNL